ncbi:MAG: cyclic nucleotide-binding domain-containing protein [Acidimicrobiaceae bacterium]|nr:cyclic nucleotide-binding domain-containing protein [Acidimicrobiaceae bacterium]
MARDSYRAFLAAVPLFAHCNARQLDQINRVATEATLPKGRVFVVEGDQGREMFVITDGTAEVTRDGKVIARLGRNDVVGELALLRHTTRNATVTATSDLSVLAVAAEDLDPLLDEIPGLAKALLQAVVTRLDPDNA